MPDDELHEVTVNYTEDAAGNPKLAQPKTIQVRNGHRIRFTRWSVPTATTVVIIFTEPHLFSIPLFDEGQPDISVIKELTLSTFYQCGLRAADGHILPESLSGPFTGGQVDPAGGNAAPDNGGGGDN